MNVLPDQHLPSSRKLHTLLKSFLVSLCFIFDASTQAQSQSVAWPKLDDRTSPQCGEALQIAKAVFDSNSFYLYAPPAIPADFPSILALGPKTLDISGGDALQADGAVFDKIPIAGGVVYWEKTPNSAYRLVMRDALFNWQGDTYSLYAIDKAIQPDDFLAEISGNGATRKFVSIAGDWRPPLVFHKKDSNAAWFIDVGEPYQVFADWPVYVVEPRGAKLRCTIRFRPHVKRAIDLLPNPVRQYEKLLDQTIGSGADEGTLHPTARLRLDVAYTWANAAQRPWVGSSPYNSSEEVKAALQSWSQQGALNIKLYREIQQQYPIAERSLAAYYQRQFARTAPQAKALSIYMLDAALRSHYVFHRDEQSRVANDDKARKSPWRDR